LASAASKRIKVQTNQALNMSPVSAYVEMWGGARGVSQLIKRREAREAVGEHASVHDKRM